MTPTETAPAKGTGPIGLDALSPMTKALFRLIENLCKKKGCFATQDWLAKKMKVSTRTIRTHKAKLLAVGLVEEVRTGRATTLRPVDFSFRVEAASYQTGSCFLSDRQNLPIRPEEIADRAQKRPYKYYSLLEDVLETNASPFAAPTSKDEPEHPHVEHIRQFDDHPQAARDVLESTVRDDIADEGDQPLLGTFRSQCVALMVEWKHLFAFRKKFMACAPGFPRGDSGDFVFYWFPDLAEICPSEKELDAALRAWVDDKRREGRHKWEQGFARNAKVPILQNIRNARRDAERNAVLAKRPEAVVRTPDLFADAAPPGDPMSFEQFGACANIAEALHRRISAGRFDLSFRGKTRIETEAVGTGPTPDALIVRVFAINEFVRHFIAGEFLDDVAQAAELATGKPVRMVKFVVASETATC